jgi:hypothetical protein
MQTNKTRKVSVDLYQGFWYYLWVHLPTMDNATFSLITTGQATLVNTHTKLYNILSNLLSASKNKLNKLYRKLAEKCPY